MEIHQIAHSLGYSGNEFNANYRFQSNNKQYKSKNSTILNGKE